MKKYRVLCSYVAISTRNLSVTNDGENQQFYCEAIYFLSGQRPPPRRTAEVKYLKEYITNKGMLQPQILRNIEGSGKYAEEQLEPKLYHLQTKKKRRICAETTKRLCDTC